MSLHPDSTAALGRIRAKAGAEKRLVFVSGLFNIVHPGHLRLLKFAADCGDFLVVGVEARQGANSVIPAELRLENIRAIGLVGDAFLLHDLPEDFVAALRPAAVVKGKEHESQPNPERKVVESYGGHLLFSSGEVVFSSLDLIKREFSQLNLSTIEKPTDFPRRHGFEVADLKKVLGKFAGLRVTVIGDVIVDEYVACEALGMSQEDPTIVVTPVLHEKFIGGAGIVASHARGLGADVSFVCVTGKDATAKFVAEKLYEYGVRSVLMNDESRPTTLKRRYRAGNKTLLRVSYLKQHGLEQELQKKVLDAVAGSIARTDLLIFSDFNYGTLPQPLVEAIVALCERHKVPMVADSQSSSQIGDVSRFRGMMLLKPTEREARLALRDFDSGLVVLAQALREKSKSKNLILTLGSEGLLVHAADRDERSWITDQLPAFNHSPRDTAGAGDSFLTCASLAMVVGTDIWQSAYLGSLAAACQIGRIGNVPLNSRDIEAEIDT